MWFRKEKIRTSDTGKEFYIYHPTIQKHGAVFIPNRSSCFVEEVKP